MTSILFREEGVNMGKNDDSNRNDLKGCIVTTGVSSLNYYNNYMQHFHKDHETLYNCMGISSIGNIDRVAYYNIIIDLTDHNIKDIVFEIFNYLLPMKADLYVKLIKDDSLNNEDVSQCNELLRRLSDHHLISLEIIDRIPHIAKKDKDTSWIQKFKNLFFFIGPGNTGKTSIITALTELCNQRGKKIALIDFTRDCKLMNYFPSIYSLENPITEEDEFKRRLWKKHIGSVDVYRSSAHLLKENEGLKNLTGYLNDLAERYDHIFINTDINTLNCCPDLFKIGDKIFIVHDIIPTKINITKHILLTFAATGINKNSSIALIYNKIIKDSFNLKTTEEKIIFNKLNNQKLIPLVDLNSKTFEIPYSKKTMRAIINNISNGDSIIYHSAYSFKRNLDYIYQYINDIPYIELEEMNISQCFKYCFEGLRQSQIFLEFRKNIEGFVTGIADMLQHISLTNYSKDIPKQ